MADSMARVARRRGRTTMSPTPAARRPIRPFPHDLKTSEPPHTRSDEGRYQQSHPAILLHDHPTTPRRPTTTMSNQQTQAPTALPSGIWAPTQVFFHPTPTADLDLPTTAAHAVRLARAGCVGIVTN